MEFEADSERQAAAEQLMALYRTRTIAVNDSEVVNPVHTSSKQEQLGRATNSDDEVVAEGSHRHDEADRHETDMDDDDETLPDIKETHDNELETDFVEGEEQAEGSNNTPRCWGDIKYPRIGTCDHEFKIANQGERYRKVVSDFFGRNKRATASIPPECYPTICRTCYQRLAYRLGSMNKDEPEKDAAAVATLRCDAIIAALEKMKEKTFVDRHGYEWPWWCGLELQLTNDGQALLDNAGELEAEIDRKNDEVAKQKAEKAKSPKGKSFKRLHRRVKPDYLPDWLQKLCEANTGDDITATTSTSTLGDRNGVRYSFDELILITKAIKTYCHESRCAFPTIEAIPVPIGLLDEQILKDKRKLRAAANNMKAKTKKEAADAERESREQPNNTLRKTIAAKRREEAKEALGEAEAAEGAVDYAQEDALLSAGTIPGKRGKSDATPGTAGKVKATLKGRKVQKIERAAVGEEDEEKLKLMDDGEANTSSISGADDDDNDSDFEEETRKTGPQRCKRTRMATKPEPKPKPVAGANKGSYKEWVKRKFGDNPPPPPGTAAEARRRLAHARWDGYAVLVKPDQPRVYSDDSEDDE